jgi:hypothetical protein
LCALYSCDQGKIGIRYSSMNTVCVQLKKRIEDVLGFFLAFFAYIKLNFNWKHQSMKIYVLDGNCDKMCQELWQNISGTKTAYIHSGTPEVWFLKIFIELLSKSEKWKHANTKQHHRRNLAKSMKISSMWMLSLLLI